MGNPLLDAINNDEVGTGNSTEDISSIINEAATRHGVDPKIAHAMAQHESGLNPQAISPAGAKGLFQLMPGTAKELGVKNIHDPRENSDAAMRYFAKLMQRYHGDVDLALAAYNAGPGNVDKYNGVPPFKETKDYINRVKGTSGVNTSVQKLNRGAEPSPTPAPTSSYTPSTPPYTPPPEAMPRGGIIGDTLKGLGIDTSPYTLEDQYTPPMVDAVKGMWEIGTGLASSSIGGLAGLGKWYMDEAMGGVVREGTPEWNRLSPEEKAFIKEDHTQKAADVVRGVSQSIYHLLNPWKPSSTSKLIEAGTSKIRAAADALGKPVAKLTTPELGAAIAMATEFFIYDTLGGGKGKDSLPDASALRGRLGKALGKAIHGGDFTEIGAFLKKFIGDAKKIDPNIEDKIRTRQNLYRQMGGDITEAITKNPPDGETDFGVGTAPPSTPPPEPPSGGGAGGTSVRNIPGKTDISTTNVGGTKTTIYDNTRNKVTMQDLIDEIERRKREGPTTPPELPPPPDLGVPPKPPGSGPGPGPKPGTGGSGGLSPESQALLDRINEIRSKKKGVQPTQEEAPTGGTTSSDSVTKRTTLVTPADLKRELLRKKLMAEKGQPKPLPKAPGSRQPATKLEEIHEDKLLNGLSGKIQESLIKEIKRIKHDGDIASLPDIVKARVAVREISALEPRFKSIRGMNNLRTTLIQLLDEMDLEPYEVDGAETLLGKLNKRLKNPVQAKTTPKTTYKKVPPKGPRPKQYTIDIDPHNVSPEMLDTFMNDFAEGRISAESMTNLIKQLEKRLENEGKTKRVPSNVSTSSLPPTGKASVYERAKSPELSITNGWTRANAKQIKGIKSELKDVFELIDKPDMMRKRKFQLNVIDASETGTAKIGGLSDSAYRYTAHRDLDGNLTMGGSGSYDTAINDHVGRPGEGKVPPGTTYVIDFDYPDVRSIKIIRNDIENVTPKPTSAQGLPSGLENVTPREIGAPKKKVNSETELESLANRQEQILAELDDPNITPEEISSKLSEAQDIQSRMEDISGSRELLDAIDNVKKTPELSSKAINQKQAYEDTVEFLTKESKVEDIEGLEFVDEQGDPSYLEAYDEEATPGQAADLVDYLNQILDDRGSWEFGKGRPKDLKKVLRALDKYAVGKGASLEDLLKNTTGLKDEEVSFLTSIAREPDVLNELDKRYINRKSKRGRKYYTEEDLRQYNARTDQINQDIRGMNKGWFRDKLRSKQRVVRDYVKGSFEIPLNQLPLIPFDFPQVNKDIRTLSSGGSPYYVFKNLFTNGANPVVDAFESFMSMNRNIENYSKWAKDVLKDIPRHSKEIREGLRPVYEKYGKAMSDRARLGKELQQLKVQAKKLNKGATYRQVKILERIDQVKADLREKAGQFPKMVQEYDQAIQEIAEKYPSARITLQAGESLPEGVAISGKEMEAAERIRDYMEFTRGRMKLVGLKTVKDGKPYMTHLWTQAMEEGGGKFLRNSIPGRRRSARTILNFLDQAPNSRIWLPDIHEILGYYIPSVERRLAFQPFHSRWATLKNSLREPELQKYMDRWWGNYIEPNTRTGLDRVVNGAVSLEYMRLIGMSLSVGLKHLTKIVGTPVNVGLWEGMTTIPKSFKIPVRKALDFLGSKGEVGRTELDLYKAFVNQRQIVRSLDEMPIFRTSSTWFKSLVAQPTVAIEAFDNGVSVLASVAKAGKRGMSFEDTHKAVWDTVLTANFRSLYDRPLWQHGSMARALTMFQQQPFKLMEYKWHMIKGAVKGDKDVFGTSYKARLVRYITVLGMAETIARHYNTSILETFLHPPFVKNLIQAEPIQSPSKDNPIPGIDLEVPKVAGPPLADLLQQTSDTNVARGLVSHFRYLGTPGKVMQGLKTTYPTQRYGSFTSHMLGLPRLDREKRSFDKTFWEHVVDTFNHQATGTKRTRRIRIGPRR